MTSWRIVDAIPEPALTRITDGVIQFGRAMASGGNASPIGCLVHEGDELIAGATGRTEYSRLFVAYLWVAEARRGEGLGSEILARLERAALERDCEDAIIETASDRNARLYARLGYETVATIPAYIGSFTKYVLVKPLRR